jgi:amidase
VNAYLASTSERVTTPTLGDLIAFDTAHAERELALFGQDVFERTQAQPGLDDADDLASRALVRQATREDGIDRLLKEHVRIPLIVIAGPGIVIADSADRDHAVGAKRR